MRPSDDGQDQKDGEAEASHTVSCSPRGAQRVGGDGLLGSYRMLTALWAFKQLNCKGTLIHQGILKDCSASAGEKDKLSW